MSANEFKRFGRHTLILLVQCIDAGVGGATPEFVVAYPLWFHPAVLISEAPCDAKIQHIEAPYVAKHHAVDLAKYDQHGQTHLVEDALCGRGMHKVRLQQHMPHMPLSFNRFKQMAYAGFLIATAHASDSLDGLNLKDHSSNTQSEIGNGKAPNGSKLQGVLVVVCSPGSDCNQALSENRTFR